MTKLKYIISFFFLFTFLKGIAQQDVQFSDYKLNMSSFNPAFAGFFDGSVLMIHRTQFVGMEGAPESKNLNINIPLTEKMGMGFNVIDEKLGVTKEQLITADYSYSIYVNDEDMLSFGLKAGVSLLNVDYSLLLIEDPTDPSFINNIENQMSPRIGIGLLYTTPKWFFAVSTPNFIKENYNPTVTSANVTTKPHIYMTTGFQTPLSSDLILKPSILAKSVANSPLALDMALNFEYMQKLRFGASYRWNSAITAIIGIDFLEHFQAGYAYDYNTSGLGKYAPSSNQFYLKFTFKKSAEIRRSCSCSYSDSPSNLGF